MRLFIFRQECGKVKHMVGFLKKSILITLSALILTGLAGCSLLQEEPAPVKSALCVNEIVSSNKQSLLDPDVGSPDWIELYNPKYRRYW